MKRILGILVAGIMMLGMGSTAQAIGVGVKVGSLGLGAELGLTLSDHFTTRLALNKYKFGADQTIDGIKYNADLDMSSTALFLDWSPFTDGSLHLTVGYVNSDNKLTATAKTGSYDIGGTNYTTNVKTVVELGSGPYVGVGWGNVPATGIGFTFELGVVQMGTPNATVTAPGALADDIATEEKRIEDDLNEYDLYPVVSAGISIGF